MKIVKVYPNNINMLQNLKEKSMLTLIVGTGRKTVEEIKMKKCPESTYK